MGRLLALTFTYVAYVLAIAIASERQQHRVQHGPCSYTFILPEVEHCHPLKDFQVTNILQRDSPPEAEPDTSQTKQSKAQKERPSWQERKLQSLESAMENNTQWLQKVRFLNCWLRRPLPPATPCSSCLFLQCRFQLEDLQTKCCRSTGCPQSAPITSVDKPSLLISSLLSWDFLDACCMDIWLHDNT